ncbi:hypothetical protein FIBSPDRAFT_905045 [Athelia psychrophila]|uniref:Uncharacterized protein n=1 Tax=Athelia psychrophila TaxID=1759441 RepID=A0A167TYE6_9AGAM|nr:hypothetical protein FIBSPDRAFT_905045 [Fibularhizoctonia sp. CBS 109695]
MGGGTPVPEREVWVDRLGETICEGKTSLAPPRPKDRWMNKERVTAKSSRVLGGVSRWLANLDRAGAAGGEDLMGRYNERFQDGKWGKRYGHKYRQSDIVPQSHLYWLGRKDEFERRRLHTLNTSSTLLICHLHWSSTCAITGRRAHNAPRTDSASGDEFVPAGGRLFLQIRYGAAAAGVVHFLCHYGQSRGPMKQGLAKVLHANAALNQ